MPPSGKLIASSSFVVQTKLVALETGVFHKGTNPADTYVITCQSQLFLDLMKLNIVLGIDSKNMNRSTFY